MGWMATDATRPISTSTVMTSGSVTPRMSHDTAADHAHRHPYRARGGGKHAGPGTRQAPRFSTALVLNPLASLASRLVLGPGGPRSRSPPLIRLRVLVVERNQLAAD